MQTTEDKIKSLSEAIKKDDHNQVYEYSKMLLKQSPDDVEYQQCFVLSSLRISLGEDLAHGIFKNPPTNQVLHHLYAYYLYNVGDFQKSIKFINSLKQTPPIKLLLAQNLFKIQQYDKSAEIMIGLLKELKLDQQQKQTYIINLFATGINNSLTTQTLKNYQQSLVKVSVKELFYNYALLMYQIGDYDRCLKYLKEFEQNLQQGDHNDVATVKLLKDLVQWKVNGRSNHINSDLYQEIDQKISDLNVRGVLKNNELFFSNTQMENTHQSLKMLDQSLNPEYKMTKTQINIIMMNKLSILLRKGRLPQAIKTLKQIQTAKTDKQELISDVEYIKNKFFLLKKSKESTGQINALIQSVSKVNKIVAFCLQADLCKEKGTETDLIGKYINSTEQIHPIIKHYIFSQLAKNPVLFDKYSEYLSELVQATKDFGILQILLSVYQNKNNLEKQEQTLEKLLKIQPKNNQIKVKLAKIYLQKGLANEAEQILRGVEGPEEISDIAYLQYIQKNIHISKKQEIKENITKQDLTKKDQKKKIKKRKKVRLPKNIEKYIQGFKGDPERWLPKWQRKGYKKKGKKGTGKTQGLATVGKEETKNIYTTGASTSAKQVTKETQKKRK